MFICTLYFVISVALRSTPLVRPQWMICVDYPGTFSGHVPWHFGSKINPSPGWSSRSSCERNVATLGLFVFDLSRGNFHPSVPVMFLPTDRSFRRQTELSAISTPHYAYWAMQWHRCWLINWILHDAHFRRGRMHDEYT